MPLFKVKDMGKSINFRKIKRRYFPVELKSGEKYLVEMPAKEIYEELVDIQEEKIADVEEELYRITYEIISRNKKDKKIREEEIEEYDTEDIVEFLRAYMGFVEELKEDENLKIPYYPGGIGKSKDRTSQPYKIENTGEKLVMDYLRINIFEVQRLPIDIFLYFMREAYIAGLDETEEGREYLNNCWRIKQTKPDRKAIRENMKKRG